MKEKSKRKKSKLKEPVRLKAKKISNGNQSLYLEFYKDGKRSYEFLKLYLLPQNDINAKVLNAHTLKVANAIKAQRIIEMIGVIGPKENKAYISDKVLLSEWFAEFKARKSKIGQSHSYANHVDIVAKHLETFGGKDVTIDEIDTAFCLGFINYLKTTLGRHGQLLSAKTCFCYFNIFASVLKSAARSRIIANNPIDALESEFKLKRPVESTREFLTETEVSLLATTPCKCEMTKRAFMFSCFCGLRLGDIRRLKWDDLIPNGNHLMISIIMQKTRRPIWLPLSDAAVVWLPEKSLDLSSETIFKMHANTNISKEIKAWANCAGINKNVTFHTARHTFATLLLTKGADLYTVSKLLGHTEISTTQIYAKIIDKKKVEAVELLNGIVCQS